MTPHDAWKLGLNDPHFDEAEETEDFNYLDRMRGVA